MAGPIPVHEELSALQAELHKAPKSETRRSSGRTASAAENRPEAAGSGAFAEQLEAQMSDLGDALSGYTGSAEDFIVKHPLVSILTAFALGVAIGRVMGRD
ncbi:hypothetical protein [Microvirga alba]|uniref:DUF883 domain-containing protein n=1 Tax=Microvirga alba TaxID=2791025 RepID=A0A931FSF0_9HYPH|nr:hypothetical protein [Microvirga alba]MBF9233646.1 hypothetical protein [Microvirga alba]